MHNKTNMNKNEGKISKKIKKSKKENSTSYILRRIVRNHAAIAGAFLILILVFGAITATWITGYSYDGIDIINSYAFPSLRHWFGTDDLGRDILTRILYGGRYTLSIGILSVAISAGLGVLVGSIAGYFGGKVDGIIMRLLDILQSFPQILLAIALSAAFGTGFDKCILALGFAGVPNFARLIRANILTIRNTEYIEAATSINCSNARIILRHVLPNTISPLIVQTSMSIANAGIAAATLSFIGLGVQPPTPEWGAMLSAARDYIRYYPHMVLFPGATIMLTTLSFNLVGDALRDALDPKMKN